MPLNLPTVAEMNAKPHATPKHAMPGRVAEKAAADVDEAKLEKACLRVVWTRDTSQCRHCHVKVHKSLERAPNRGEGHHIASRADRAVRFDPRNRILVCSLCHERIELNKLFIVATAKQMFVSDVNGKSYMDASKKLKFIAGEKP